MTNDPLDAALRGYDPVVRPPVLSGADVGYAVDDTAIGRMLFAVREDGAVVASRFVPDDDAEQRLLQKVADRVSPRVLRSARRTDTVRRQVEEYLAGRRRELDVPTDTALMGDFQRQVLTTLPQVAGFGILTTYGTLAAAAGAPKAARAVGAALGANPLCVVLPCHRVVGSTGSLTGYAGGTAAKTLLLRLEGSA